jgi:hypothetical protein
VVAVSVGGGAGGQVTVEVPADGGDPTVSYDLPGIAAASLGNVANADFLAKAIAAGVIDQAKAAFLEYLIGTVPPLSMVGTPPTQGTVGATYSWSPQVSGGVPPYSFTASAIPSGLSVSATSGAISGSPTVAQTVAVVLTVTDSRGTQDTLAWSITVSAAPSDGWVTLFEDDSTKPLSVRKGSVVTANGVTWGPFSHYAMSNNAVGNYTTFEWTDGYATADPHQHGGRRDDQSYLLNCAADAIKQTGYMPVTRDTAAGTTTLRLDRIADVKNLANVSIPADFSTAFGVTTHVGALLSMQHSLFGPPPYEVIYEGVDDPDAGSFWGADWMIQADSHQSALFPTEREDGTHTETDQWERTGAAAALRKVFINQLYIRNNGTAGLVGAGLGYTEDLGVDVHSVLWDHRLVVTTTDTKVYLRQHGDTTWLLQHTKVHPSDSRFGTAPVYTRSEIKAGYRWGENTALVAQLTSGTAGFVRKWKKLTVRTTTTNQANWTNRTIDPATIPALSVSWAVNTSAIDNASANGTILASATTYTDITYEAEGPSGIDYEGDSLKITGSIPPGTWMVTTWATRGADGARFVVETKEITVEDNAQWWDDAAKVSLNFESQQVRLGGTGGAATSGTWSDYIDGSGDPTTTLKAMLPGYAATGVLVMQATGAPASFQGLYGFFNANTTGPWAFMFHGNSLRCGFKDGAGTDTLTTIANFATAGADFKAGLSWASTGIKACGNGGTVASSASAFNTTSVSGGKLWTTAYGDVPFTGTKQRLFLYDPDDIGGSAGALVSDAILQSKTS